MNHFRKIVAATVMAAMIGASGCNVFRGESTPGEYVDDVAITASVKTIVAAGAFIGAILLSFLPITRHASTSEVTQSAVPPAMNAITTMSQAGR